MSNVTELRTVPTFTFYQIDEDGMEQPINVIYWNGSIELEQSNSSILLYPDTIKELFKQIQKNIPEAQRALDR